MEGGGSGIACPGFSVLRFRREFLSRMRISKGNRDVHCRTAKNSCPCVRLSRNHSKQNRYLHRAKEQETACQCLKIMLPFYICLIYILINVWYLLFAVSYNVIPKS